MSDFTFFIKTLLVANKQDPFPGPGSVYIKNLLCFGFEALVDISITHSKACTKKTGALRKTGINRAKQEIRQDTLSKRQETFFRSSGQVGGGCSVAFGILICVLPWVRATAA